MSNKKKVSRFEFAIMEIADPEASKLHEPYTEEEELQQRIDKIRKQFSELKIKSMNTIHPASLLTLFWQSSSDACPLEVSQMEAQEKAFEKFIEDINGTENCFHEEEDVVYYADTICLKYLPDDMYKQWEAICGCLKQKMEEAKS